MIKEYFNDAKNMLKNPKKTDFKLKKKLKDVKINGVKN